MLLNLADIGYLLPSAQPVAMESINAEQKDSASKLLCKAN